MKKLIYVICIILLTNVLSAGIVKGLEKQVDASSKTDDKVKHASSTESQLQQISIPIIDGEKVLGATPFGLDIKKL